MIVSVTFTLKGLARIESHESPTGKATGGFVSICINSPPYFLNHTCNGSMRARPDGFLRENHSCFVMGGDPEGGPVTYDTDGSFATVDSITGNVTLFGDLDGPNGSQPSAVDLPIQVQDNSSCDNNVTTEHISLGPIDYSGRVLLIQEYPSNDSNELQLKEGYTTIHKSLDEYFRDVDGYNLTYNYIPHSVACFRLNLEINNVTNVVRYSPGYDASTTVSGPCELEFRASNPFGDWNITNMVNISVEDTPIEGGDGSVGEEGDEEAGGGGGGGGSSGGMASGGADEDFEEPEECEYINLSCTEWSECRYLEYNETNRHYNRTNDGLMSRYCTVTTNCPDQFEPNQEMYCDYKPTCTDRMQNCHELSNGSLWCEKGVDCGGPCTPCPNCSDWIQNQGEKGVDCGGPCDQCNTCYDGIMNCRRTENHTLICEDSVDCGGPCLPCPNCSDGIKNCHVHPDGSLECEEGVDCGGPCLETCQDTQMPIGQGRLDPVDYLLIVIIIICTIILTYNLKNRIMKFIQEKYMQYLKHILERQQDELSRNYLGFFDKQVALLQGDFDSVTSDKAKAEGDRLLHGDQTTGYNIDRYSVSFDNDYADILTDNTQTTINYAFYASNPDHGKRILKEIMKAGIKPNYQICKRSSSVQWDDDWTRDENAEYDRVNGTLIARTVEYILTFKPKNDEEINKIINVLESYGKGKKAKEQQDAWDIPDIRITGTKQVRNYEKQILNTKSVGGQQLIVLTKDKPLQGFKSNSIQINPGLAKFIK